MPRLSVVTPSYNHAEFLQRRANSILAQTFLDLEWIVVDDCSIDNSFEIFSTLCESDSRVRLFRNATNCGLGITTNTAISHSSGDYIYRAESDDFCDLTLFEHMVKALDEDPQVALVFSRTLRITDEDISGGLLQQRFWKKRYSPGNCFYRLLNRNFIPGCNCMVRRTALDQVGGFYNGNGIAAIDYHMSLRLARQFAVMYLPYPNGYHRSHSRNLGGEAHRSRDLALVEVDSYSLVASIVGFSAGVKYDPRSEEASSRRLVSTRILAPMVYKAQVQGCKEFAKGLLELAEKWDPWVTKSREWRLALLARGIERAGRVMLGR
jgi:glycosyltransferase involved in cell wall biosynthesis